MRPYVVLAFLFTCPAVYCQNLPKPLTHVAACSRFSKSVVRIDTAGGRGTGFIVSSDGYVLTAAHVVIDGDTGQYFRAIDVTSPKLWSELATPVLDITEAATHDFALLKINKTGLPFLESGNDAGLEIGSDLTVIGFPFSALDEKGEQINIRFCLSESVTATTSFGIGKSQVNVIFFQGVSVKGISGSPIISHKTGQVVGVVNTKLTGVGPELQKLRDDIAHGKGTGISLGGIDPNENIGKVLNVLDLQLANGLGSGTGAADVAYALQKAKRAYARQHPIHP